MAEKKKKKKTDGSGEIKKKQPAGQQEEAVLKAAGALECDCSGRIKERTEKEYRDLVNRLNRIEGQVRGIRGMLEKDAYCPDILIQVAAVNAALNSFNKVLLASHIKTCVVEHMKEGDDSVIDELVALLQKLMK